MQILQLDIQGYPQNWISSQQAASYYATDSVAWTVGEVCQTLHGGFNARSGLQSHLEIHPILAVNGASKTNLFDVVPSLSNAKLFKRDRYQCAYCGASHGPSGAGLTRDHIYPKARGGDDVWINVVSACRGCNGRKACRSPEEAGMPLLFAPYVPSVFEDFLLAGRSVRGDVHAWLASRVSKQSRWYARH
jgi:hypothetical protein